MRFSRSGRDPVFVAALFCTTVFVWSRPLAAQSPSGPRSAIEAEIARLDSTWLSAYVTRDVEAVRPILADDFVGQVYQTMMDKDDILARVAGASGVLATRVDRLIVNVYGDLAVAHALRTDTHAGESGPREVRYAYTDVYRFRDGRWQCITGQSAPVADG